MCQWNTKHDLMKERERNKKRKAQGTLACISNWANRLSKGTSEESCAEDTQAKACRVYSEKINFWDGDICEGVWHWTPLNTTSEAEHNISYLSIVFFRLFYWTHLGNVCTLNGSGRTIVMSSRIKLFYWPQNICVFNIPNLKHVMS